MIVDQFNTTLSGGAAIAARRLHHSLIDRGVCSRFWYCKKRNATAPEEQGYYSADHAWSRSVRSLLAFPTQQLHKIRFKNALRNRPADLEFFSSPTVFPPTKIDLSRIQTDVIHLHWISKLIDYSTFFGSIPDDFPIVWTLHDMNPFTGGCHHSDNCQLFQTSCQSCPQIRNPGQHDISTEIFDIKRTALAQKNLHIVTPSRWMEERVRASKILGSARSIQTIRNGLDTTVFKPRDKKVARDRFGIPQNKIVLGFGAASLENRRKGFPELLRSLTLLANHDKYFGLTFGDGKLPSYGNQLPPLKSTGYLDKPEAIADFYAALDLFVITSLAENMPQTVVESMACGIPVIGFSVGGISEIVQPNRTGMLSSLGNCSQLASQITELGENSDLRNQMRHTSREIATTEFEQSLRTEDYQELYASAISVSQRSCRQAA